MANKFTVVLDACVLYPAPLRDALMRLALAGLYKAHWTDAIHDEWITALLREGKHRKEKLEQTRKLMDQHIRDAKVTRYEGLIQTLDLPDPDDRHVLAAAIRCNADAIVTYNTRDFPTDALSPFGIEVIHPDDFLYYQIDMDPSLCCQALREQREALKNPTVDADTFLNVLQKQQLPQTVSKLREFESFL